MSDIKKLLIVVDMQNDFIDGTLKNDEAIKILPNVVDKIKNWDDDVVVTQDTHDENYLSTKEGQYLPIKHCIRNTDGHKVNKDIMDIFKHCWIGQNTTFINKRSFGSLILAELAREKQYKHIELIGVCTDICVITNALLLKTYMPESTIVVDSKCCAGLTKEKHEAALEVMRSCQIEVI